MPLSPEVWLSLAGLRALSVGDPDAADLVVVCLHGFQMTPEDLAPFAHSMALPAWFLFPEGPLPAQPRGRAWWHIDAGSRLQALARGPRDFALEHPPDLPSARAQLNDVLDAVAARSPGRPLIVAGFSQGGMLTCDTLLRTPREVAGVALLSASRIAHDEWQPLLAARPWVDRPVLISHGEQDDDLSFAAGEALRACLVESGANVTWMPFAGGHEIPLVVWRHLRRFLQAVGARRGTRTPTPFGTGT